MQRFKPDVFIKNTARYSTQHYIITCNWIRLQKYSLNPLEEKWWKGPGRIRSCLKAGGKVGNGSKYRWTVLEFLQHKSHPYYTLSSRTSQHKHKPFNLARLFYLLSPRTCVNTIQCPCSCLFYFSCLESLCGLSLSICPNTTQSSSLVYHLLLNHSNPKWSFFIFWNPLPVWLSGLTSLVITI